jgi:hypothetical protein
VFTLEICARLDIAPALLDQLRPIVQSAPELLTRDEAWGRHAAAANVLMQSFDNVERGCWEYFDDESRAMSIFDDWCRPVIDRVVPRPGPSGIPDYRSPGPRYALFTMVYLLARDSPSDLQVRRTCAIDERALWEKKTFRRLLGAVRALSFASVKSDCLYMTPRDHEWGLTGSDLATPTYEYLRMLEGS